ncbi:TMhelix containing protein [Vibrio phage 1.232.O._10N.261.51.E11]|nr:TMhelix containing protein [Vibrio phage 1.232.O._10N.261.51.E11]
MDYLITNLIDELLWQIEDISFYAVIAMAYFGTAIAQYAGKYAALRENDKALKPIANAFYTGARFGLRATHPTSGDGFYCYLQIREELFSAKTHKRSVWA